MRIAAKYSHLNGWEYMVVHHKDLWDEIQAVIASVDAEACKTKVSKEKTMRGRLLYSPVDMNDAFAVSFSVSTSSAFLLGFFQYPHKINVIYRRHLK